MKAPYGCRGRGSNGGGAGAGPRRRRPRADRRERLVDYPRGVPLTWLPRAQGAPSPDARAAHPLASVGLVRSLGQRGRPAPRLRLRTRLGCASQRLWPHRAALVPGLYVYRLSLSLECSWVQKRKKRWRLDEARPQMLDLLRTQRLSPCFADRGGASARVGPEHCRRLGKGRPASHATTLVRDAR